MGGILGLKVPWEFCLGIVLNMLALQRGLRDSECNVEKSLFQHMEMMSSLSLTAEAGWLFVQGKCTTAYKYLCVWVRM